MHIWLPRRPELLPTLDERLTAAAALVREGEPVADIGCDHGKLTAVLAASGKYPKVIGADLRPGPLAKAKQTLEHARCEDRAELRIGDGLSVLSAGEVGTIVLAGVSAQTTWEIIEKAPWVSQPGGPRLVMVPATPPQGAAPLAVGAWLCPGGRPPRAGGRPLVCRDGRRVHGRDACPHVYGMPVWRNRGVAGGPVTRPGRKPSFPASGWACPTAPRWPGRSTNFAGGLRNGSRPEDL